MTVGTGQAVRFAPGEYQSGRNQGPETPAVLGLGAPRDGTDVRLPVSYADCEHGNLRLDTGDSVALVCPDCGAKRRSRPCPASGGELQTTLGEADAPVTTCRVCGHLRATADRVVTGHVDRRVRAE